MKNPDICEITDIEQQTYSWQIMEECLPPELVVEYKQAFRMLDSKLIGKISVEDISTVASSLGYALPESEVLEFAGRVVDLNNISTKEKCVAFPEFLATMATIITNCVTEDEVLRIFSEFDRDGDGYISPVELRNLLISLGEEVTDQEVQAMMREADRDGDGMVSLQEFIQVMSSSPNSSDTSYINISRTLSEEENRPFFSTIHPSCSIPCCSSEMNQSRLISVDAGSIDCELDSNLNNVKLLHSEAADKTKSSDKRRRRSVIDWFKSQPKDNRTSQFCELGSSSEGTISSSSCSLSSMSSSNVVKERERRRSSLTKTLRNGRNAIVATARSLRKLSR